MADGHQRQMSKTDEYAESVNAWLQQCYYWHDWMRTCSAMRASFLMGQQQQHHLLTLQQQQQQQQHQHGNAAQADENQQRVLRQRPPWHSILDRLMPAAAAARPGGAGNNAARLTDDDGNAVHPSAVPVLTELGGRLYRVPSVWTRFTAESIDFAILFLLKLFVTFLVMDFFDVIDLEKYDLGTLQSSTLDYKFALKLTSEIFFLELIYRIVVCFFEALCLHQGTNGVGGATPGKNLLGLRVVTCETVVRVQDGQIVVWPAADMGFSWALLRSIIKNFAMAFFLPACITMLFFPFNRTVYDILCGCIVVEDIRPPPPPPPPPPQPPRP